MEIFKIVENYHETVAKLAYWCSIEEFFFISPMKTEELTFP